MGNLRLWVRSLVKKSGTQTAIAFEKRILKVRSLYGSLGLWVRSFLQKPG
ncbi:hypothetical protein H6G76_31980 [Nostoc sp. FACHB-152]|nr:MULTISPECIES: hypothetical protein [unclassified Nostoc]MBD2451657.1 hypothetical protein [Nostoc sp. FACHB-152]MBD2472759.1 hypothetical protein [Nostoc sp. FACHB-145]